MSQAKKRRLNERVDSSGGSAKRPEEILGKIANEYICPITTELPLDPVLAQDARIYERSAIEQWIRQQGRNLRSPVTNEPMGPNLVPAIQVRNTIEELVRSGSADEGISQRWNQKIADEKYITKLEGEANVGDIKAMHSLGVAFYEGLHGLTPEKSRGYKWWKKASDDGRYAPSMARAGYCLVTGNGVGRHEREGQSLLGAAGYKDGGSDLAAYYLGMWYSNGKHGLPADFRLAMYWITKVVDGTCKFQDASRSDKEKAERELRNLKFLTDYHSVKTSGDARSASSGSSSSDASDSDSDSDSLDSSSDSQSGSSMDSSSDSDSDPLDSSSDSDSDSMDSSSDSDSDSIASW